MPSWAPIYFSIDYDAAVDGADNYFKGVKSVLGLDRTGVYGSYGLCLHLKQSGLVRFAWRTMSIGWRGGAGPAGMDELQTGGGTIAGLSIDKDIALVDDYGGWLLGEEVALTQDDADLVAGAILSKILGSTGPTVAVALQSGYQNSVSTKNSTADLDSKLDALKSELDAHASAPSGSPSPVDVDALAKAIVALIAAKLAA
jgi:hypothetical protein